MVALVVSACGSDGGGGGADADPGGCDLTGRLLPLVPGTSWRYRVTDLSNNTTEVKTQTVGELEDVGGAKAGTMGYRMTTQKQGGTVISWQEDTGDRILRHREQDMAGGAQSDEIYEPYKLRIDESAMRMQVGAQWTETYQEVITDTATNATTTTDKSEMWSVVAVGEVIDVDAGTFCTVRMRKVSQATVSGSDKTYWFAPGVGKVRELSDTRDESLVQMLEP